MTSDLEGRIARVLVTSQHPSLPPAKVDELVALGVGRATARMVVEELQRWPRARGVVLKCQRCGISVTLAYVARDDIPAGIPIISDGVGTALLGGWQAIPMEICAHCAVRPAPAERLGPLPAAPRSTSGPIVVPDVQKFGAPWPAPRRDR